MKNYSILKKLRTPVCVLYMLLCFQILAAQNTSCQGWVVDAASNEPIPYATVRLFTSDSTLYTGCITDEAGHFLMKGLLKDNYLCCITYLGAIPIYIPISTIEKQNYDIGKVHLSFENNLLQEVVVEGKAALKKTIDRTVYQIDTAMLARATETSDVFKKIPETHVSPEGSVNIRGKNTTMIMVNGVLLPTKVSLKTIDIKDIETIEIITAPSSEYENDIGGVINIILKEKMKPSYGFNMGGSWCSLPTNRMSIGGGFQFNSEKIRYRFSANYAYESPKKQRDSIYREDFEKKEIYQSITKPLKETIQTTFIDNNFDYYINKNNFLHISSRNIFFPNNSQKQNFTTNYINNALIDSISTLSNRNENYTTGNYTLFYRKKFTKERQSMTFNYNFYHLHRNTKLRYDKIAATDTINSSPYSRTSTENARRYSHNLKADYYHPISRKVSFSTGKPHIYLL